MVWILKRGVLDGLATSMYMSSFLVVGFLGIQFSFEYIDNFRDVLFGIMTEYVCDHVW